MPHLITTAPDLCQFLLTRMRETGPAVAYPALFAAYVDQFIGGLSSLQRDTDRLYPHPASNRCPCCGVDAGAAVLAALTSAADGGRLGTCNRLFAALAIDLLAQLPLGLGLREINAALIGVLALDRDGFVRLAAAGNALRWETTRAGEAALGTAVWVPHRRA